MLISRIISRNSPVVAQIRYRRSTLSTETIIVHKDVVDKHKRAKHVEELNQERSRLAADEDMPVQGMSNPYLKPAEKCLICKHNIPLDWKNTRLLSQFTSPYTGRIYDRGVTGLCLFMQRRISKLIIRSRYFGYMPYEMKDPKFVKDPQLFDPFKRK